MSANIEALVVKHCNDLFNPDVTGAQVIRNALTEQAETHALELRAYEATVQNLEQRIRELEVQSASVGIIDSNCSYLPFAGRVCNKCGRIHDGGKSVVVEPVAWVNEYCIDEWERSQKDNWSGARLTAKEVPGSTVPLFRKPTKSIHAAELATLREKAAMVDELQKRAERMQKALLDIAEWTDRYTTPGHPIANIARAAIAGEK